MVPKEVVGIRAAKMGNRFESFGAIRQGMGKYFGDFGPGIAAGLNLRDDHGSQYLSNAFQEHTAFLGMESNQASMRSLEGDGCADQVIRTQSEQ
jgi:hypothetical protein